LIKIALWYADFSSGGFFMTGTPTSLNSKDQKRLSKLGKGTGLDYEPYVDVRSFSSQGTSVRLKSATVGRIHHLVSGLEAFGFILFDRFENSIDLREQYPLPIEESLEVSRQLGIRHPNNRGYLTVVSTDLLVALKDGKQLAISFKYAEELHKARNLEKLQIEKAYWEARGVEWKIFTELELTGGLKENLEWIPPYLLAEASEAHQLSELDVSSVLGRIDLSQRTKLARQCSKLDDKYDVEPGYHISVVRYGVAHHLVSAPLDRAFHEWYCCDVVPLRGSSIKKEAGLAS